MNNDIVTEINRGIKTAFFDASFSSNLAYKPQFISNNYKEGKKVLTSIESELLSCEEFFISVAFITMGGITPLLPVLKELEERNICGRILTTDYLDFSSPEALNKLAEFNNITLKMYSVDNSKEGFHTKGYIFKNSEVYRIIVGSANLTLSALTKNYEWNTKIISSEQGEYAKEIIEEFDRLWNSDTAYYYDEFIDRYTARYNMIKKQRAIAVKEDILIPIALSGDRSYNKDNIRRYVLEGERIIPGSSTIHFDAISKKRIFAAIDAANFSDIKLIKENYRNLKNKLGRIPSLMDFDKYGEMDVLRIFDNNSLGSYYRFLVKYEKEYKIRLSASEEKVIEFISKKLASGKRIHELELLNRMLTYRVGLLNILKKSLDDNYNIQLDDKVEKNIINIMTNEFLTGSGKSTYADCVFIEKDTNIDDYNISESFQRMLSNPEFYKIFKELVEFGIMRYKLNYSERYRNTDFVLYKKYTYEDVCRLLNWEANEIPLNIGGYKYDKSTKTLPVFINYDKSEDIQDTIKYEDHFKNASTLIAISKQSRTKDSEDVQNFLKAEERGIKVELFVRKNKDDKISKEFYYLGHMKATGQIKEFVMTNTDKTAVEIEWILDTPVREDIYEYIVNG